MTSLDELRSRAISCVLVLFVATLASIAVLAEPQRFASSADANVMVELYTSEGCSSCPPADRWLRGLIDDPGLWTRIVPLAFHVDYWDYIGWRDPYATPFHGLRQARYAEVGAVSQVYTPGFVVNGSEWRGWIVGQPLAPPRRSPGVLTVEMIDSVRARVEFKAGDARPQPLTISIALLGFGLESAVSAGENAGQALRHDFVVLGLVEVPMLGNPHGSSAEVALPPLARPANRLALAAWVSRPGNPAPLQAVGGWLRAGL